MIYLNGFFNRLHYSGQKIIFINDLPEEFVHYANEMREYCEIHTTLYPDIIYDFMLVFAYNQQDLIEKTKDLTLYTKVNSTIWLIIPKFNSKKIKSDFDKNYIFPKYIEENFKKMQRAILSPDWVAYKFKKF